MDKCGYMQPWDMELDGALPATPIAAGGPGQADIDEFRRLSAEAAAGVAVVSTRLRGRDYAATVSAYLSVSYDPPTMLVSLYAESRIAHAVLESGAWALSLLTPGHRGAANWLASPGTPVEGLLERIAFRRGPATQAAVLEGALAYFELETAVVHTAATHLLVVGTVRSMGAQEDPGPAAGPLLHYGGQYRQLR